METGSDETPSQWLIPGPRCESAAWARAAGGVVIAAARLVKRMVPSRFRVDGFYARVEATWVITATVGP